MLVWYQVVPQKPHLKNIRVLVSTVKGYPHRLHATVVEPSQWKQLEKVTVERCFSYKGKYGRTCNREHVRLQQVQWPSAEIAVLTRMHHCRFLLRLRKKDKSCIQEIILTLLSRADFRKKEKKVILPEASRQRLQQHSGRTYIPTDLTAGTTRRTQPKIKREKVESLHNSTRSYWGTGTPVLTRKHHCWFPLPFRAGAPCGDIGSLPARIIGPVVWYSY